jgi:hypothetical protein
VSRGRQPIIAASAKARAALGTMRGTARGGILLVIVVIIISVTRGAAASGRRRRLAEKRPLATAPDASRGPARAVAGHWLLVALPTVAIAATVVLGESRAIHLVTAGWLIKNMLPFTGLTGNRGRLLHTAVPPSSLWPLVDWEPTNALTPLMYMIIHLAGRLRNPLEVASRGGRLPLAEPPQDIAAGCGRGHARALHLERPRPLHGVASALPAPVDTVRPPQLMRVVAL